MEDIYREGIHRTRFQKELVIIDLQTEMNSQIIKGISVLTDYLDSCAKQFHKAIFYRIWKVSPHGWDFYFKA